MAAATMAPPKEQLDELNAFVARPEISDQVREKFSALRDTGREREPAELASRLYTLIDIEAQATDSEDPREQWRHARNFESSANPHAGEGSRFRTFEDAMVALSTQAQFQAPLDERIVFANVTDPDATVRTVPLHPEAETVEPQMPQNAVEAFIASMDSSKRDEFEAHLANARAEVYGPWKAEPGSDAEAEDFAVLLDQRGYDIGALIAVREEQDKQAAAAATPEPGAAAAPLPAGARRANYDDLVGQPVVSDDEMYALQQQFPEEEEAPPGAEKPFAHDELEGQPISLDEARRIQQEADAPSAAISAGAPLGPPNADAAKKPKPPQKPPVRIDAGSLLPPPQDPKGDEEEHDHGAHPDWHVHQDILAYWQDEHRGAPYFAKHSWGSNQTDLTIHTKSHGKITYKDDTMLLHGREHHKSPENYSHIIMTARMKWPENKIQITAHNPEARVQALAHGLAYGATIGQTMTPPVVNIVELIPPPSGAEMQTASNFVTTYAGLYRPDNGNARRPAPPTQDPPGPNPPGR